MFTSLFLIVCERAGRRQGASVCALQQRSTRFGFSTGTATVTPEGPTLVFASAGSMAAVRRPSPAQGPGVGLL